MKKFIFGMCLCLISCESKITSTFEQARSDYCIQNPIECVNSSANLSSSVELSSVNELSSIAVSSMLISSVSLSSIALSSSLKSSSAVVSSLAQSSVIASSLALSSVAKSSSSSVIASSSVAASSASGSYGTLTDSRDGQSYKTIVINGIEWMAQNLNYGSFIDDGASSATLQSGAQKFCYNNIASNCLTDGGLYQWHTVMGFANSCATTSCASQISSGNHKGLCPLGWHVPKTSEWNTLQTFLGGASVAGSKMKLNNTGFSGWDASAYNSGNTSKFSSLPAGFRSVNGGFMNRDSTSMYWEAGEWGSGDVQLAYDRMLSQNYADLAQGTPYKRFGISLRCIKD